MNIGDNTPWVVGRTVANLSITSPSIDSGMKGVGLSVIRNRMRASRKSRSLDRDSWMSVVSDIHVQVCETNSPADPRARAPRRLDQPTPCAQLRVEGGHLPRISVPD